MFRFYINIPNNKWIYTILFRNFNYIYNHHFLIYYGFRFKLKETIKNIGIFSKFCRECPDTRKLILILSNIFCRVFFGLLFFSCYISFIPFKKIGKFTLDIQKMKSSGKNPEFKDIDVRIYLYLMNFLLMILSTIYVSIFLPIIKNISTCTLVGMYYHQKNNNLMKSYLKASLTSYLGVIAFHPIHNFYIILKDIFKIITLIVLIFIFPLLFLLKKLNYGIYYIFKIYYKPNINYKESIIYYIYTKYHSILKWCIKLKYVIIYYFILFYFYD